MNCQEFTDGDADRKVCRKLEADHKHWRSLVCRNRMSNSTRGVIPVSLQCMQGMIDYGTRGAWRQWFSDALMLGSTACWGRGVLTGTVSTFRKWARDICGWGETPGPFPAHQGAPYLRCAPDAPGRRSNQIIGTAVGATPSLRRQCRPLPAHGPRRCGGGRRVQSNRRRPGSIPPVAALFPRVAPAQR